MFANCYTPFTYLSLQVNYTQLLANDYFAKNNKQIINNKVLNKIF